MGSWLASAWNWAFGGVSSAITAAVKAILSPIVQLIDSIFSDVTGAWDELATAVERQFDAAVAWIRATYDTVHRIITYDIPHYAYVAWWWVSHPFELAAELFWHLIRLLERRAWEVTRWLGEFALGLVVNHAREFATVLEDIFTAVL